VNDDAFPCELFSERKDVFPFWVGINQGAPGIIQASSPEHRALRTSEYISLSDI
jgi:hypothetical protein